MSINQILSIFILHYHARTIKKFKSESHDTFYIPAGKKICDSPLRLNLNEIQYATRVAYCLPNVQNRALNILLIKLARLAKVKARVKPGLSHSLTMVKEDWSSQRRDWSNLKGKSRGQPNSLLGSATFAREFYLLVHFSADKRRNIKLFFIHRRIYEFFDYGCAIKLRIVFS